MQKVPSNSAKLLKEKAAKFNRDMVSGSAEVLLNDFKEILPYKDNKVYGLVCRQIMWRLVCSMKKADEVKNEQRFYRASKVLHTLLPYLSVDNKNRRAVRGYMEKYGLSISPLLARFLDVYNPDEKPLISTRTRLRELKDYYRTSQDFGLNLFQKNTEEFLELLSDYDTDEKLIHFSALYTMMQRRAKVCQPPRQASLFEEARSPKKDIDKELVTITAKLYAKLLVKNKKTSNLTPLFRHKFSNMMVAIVAKNSFSRDEVKKLAANLKAVLWVSTSVEDELNHLGAHLVDVYDLKKNKEIGALNRWYNHDLKKMPLEKAAWTGVYVQMLYQKLIYDEDIGKERYDLLYRKEKNALKEQVASSYSFKDPKVVLDEYQDKMQERFYEINRCLNAHYRKSSFYFSVLANAKKGGLKDIVPQDLLLRQKEDYYSH